ncbi:hypothetical protein D1AOALGA4SA_4248 [Olavius algarvensis Delta 1 endosymbiont]|nr:hypothetical protein D1AOALGA4SA_4248 [Olavius algarvensis Delta 1 endosymbiont]
MTNVECRLTNDGIASLSLFKQTVRQKTHDRQNTLFDVRCWTFDVRRSRESQAHCAQS